MVTLDKKIKVMIYSAGVACFLAGGFMMYDSFRREYNKYGELSQETENVPEFLSGIVILAGGLFLYGSYSEFKGRSVPR